MIKADEPADGRLLRLYVTGEGWTAYDDKLNEVDNKVEAIGSRRAIESVLINALNATNLILLTGAGSSFSAKNNAGKTPASMKDLWTSAKTRAGEDVFSKVCTIFSSASFAENIEKLLTLCKLYLELNENSNNAEAMLVRNFVQEAELAILDRVDFVNSRTELDAHTSFIQKIGRRGNRKPRARFFTTNYDLCFEEAARRHRFTVIDGFSHGLEQIYDPNHFFHDIVRRDAVKNAPDYIENVFHLYKLHGSIDWRRIDGEIVRSRTTNGSPVLIYPRSSKYQEAFEAPYLDMIGALQSALREPDTAVVVSGFGFNDDHLSRPIISAIEANMSLRLVVCDPIFLETAALDNGEHVVPTTPAPSNKSLGSLIRLAASGDPRIHLINARFSDLAKLLPDLVGETDLERHVARMRAIRDDPEQVR